MKICPQCQTENLDVAWKCKSCGMEFAQAENPEDPYKLAKTSRILGCLSALIVPAVIGALLNSQVMAHITMILFGIAAFITGMQALSKFKSIQNKKGKGMAIVGTALGSLFTILAVCSLTGLILGPALQESFWNVQESLGTPLP